MTQEERRRIRDAVNSRPLTNYIKLEKSRYGDYVCPVCKSGEGPNHSGALHIYDNRVVCFSGHCFDSGTKQGTDTLGALRIIWNCGETDVFERLGMVEPRTTATKTAPSAKPKEAPKPMTDFSTYYQDAEAALWAPGGSAGLDYLHGRGLSDKTIKHFHLGYVPSWTNPAGKRGSGTARIIVPTSKCGYLARAIHPVKDPEKDSEKIHAGKKQPFNLGVLTPEMGSPAAKDDAMLPPIIVEGVFDAMAMWEWGYKNAIAINGLSTGDLIEAAKKTAPDVVFILALDNDKAGLEAQPKELDRMTAAGLACIGADQSAVYGDEKDAGDVHVAGHAEKCCGAITPYLSAAYEQRKDADEARARERYLQTGAGMVDAFLEKITSEAYKPVPTNIQAIDRAMGGGFMRQTLVLLGAEPGAGKTALASQIFENMAKQGSMTLYFNLEMSREQLIARSLARIAYQVEGEKISAVEVLQGYRHSNKTASLVNRAASAYKEDIADGILYNPGGTGANLDAILEYIEEEARREEAQGREAPFICLDYLQLLTGREREDDATILKRAVAALKGYATSHNSIVFCIMAQSRNVNKSGEATQAAGRDTSALEYSADLQLQLIRADDEGDDERQEGYRDVDLYVTKNRFGIADTRKGHGTTFHFLGGQALFIPVSDREPEY